MTAIQVFTLVCDRCGTTSRYVSPIASLLREKAEIHGWKVGHPRDYCPSCSVIPTHQIGIGKLQHNEAAAWRFGEKGTA